MSRPALLLVALLGALSLLGGACSSGDDDGPVVDTSQSDDKGTLPVFTGEDECVDEEGDVEGASPLSPPEILAEADLVTASATANDETVSFRFVTAGPGVSTTDVRFQVSKGASPQDPQWFELAAELEVDVWKVTLYGAPDEATVGQPGVGAVTELPIPVTREGDTVTFEVRSADLPDLDAAADWQYGTRVGADQAIIDICSPFDEEQ